MSNRELFDMLITRTTSCKSITPQRTLTKMLSALELFLENWGWFDDDESTPEVDRRYLWEGRISPDKLPEVAHLLHSDPRWIRHVMGYTQEELYKLNSKEYDWE
jgi:hypothetical protein